MNQDSQAAGSEHQLPGFGLPSPIFDLKVKQHEITKPSYLGSTQAGRMDICQRIIISKHGEPATN